MRNQPLGDALDIHVLKQSSVVAGDCAMPDSGWGLRELEDFYGSGCEVFEFLRCERNEAFGKVDIQRNMYVDAAVSK